MTEATSTAERTRLTWAVAWLLVVTILCGRAATWAVPHARTTMLTLTLGAPAVGAAIGAVIARDRRGADLAQRIVLSAAWASSVTLAATVGYLLVMFVFVFLVLGGFI